MKAILRILAVGLLVGMFALPVRAAEFRSSEESITVSESQKTHDLHLAGKNITVDAPVTGDLTIGGGTVLSNGDVENSLFIAGGTVTVRSHVHHHVRIAGGTVTLSGIVDGDVYIAGGDVTISESATIAGGVYVASGTLAVNGTVIGELRVGSGTVTIDSAVGPATIYSDEVKLKSKAKINGDFNYHSARQATVDTGAVITGATHYTEVQSSRLDKYGFLFGAVFTLGYLLRLLGAILLGWLLIHFWPKTSRKIADFAFTSPLSAIGYGFLVMIGLFIGAMVLVFTIIGMGLASVMLGLWFLLMLVGSIYGKILLGSWVYRLFKREEGYQLTLATVAIGVVVSSILMLVAFIGPLVAFVMFLLGVGGIFNLLVHSREDISPTTPTN